MKRVATDLGRWAADVRWDTIPPDIQNLARVAWLDTLGCMLLGASHPETVALGKTLGEREWGGFLASAVGPVPKLSPMDASFVNGVAVGVDLYDGGGSRRSKGHVAGWLLAPVLAAAEETDASLAQTLASFVVGYEISARISAGLQLRNLMHPSATWSIISAAAAIGYLRGMNAQELAQVMELAANLTMTTSWDAAVQGANVSSLYYGMVSYIARMAADLVPAGFRGGPRSIELTFSTTLSGEKEYDEARCLDGLGDSWLLPDIFFKRYPVCFSCIPALDALFDAVNLLPRPFDIERDSVRVGAHPRAYLRNCEIHNETDLAARTSLPVTIAIALIFGEVVPETFRDGKYADPRVLPLAKRISIEEALPEVPGARPGWVELSQSGAPPIRSYRHFCAGDAKDPFPFELIRDKFVADAQPLLGPEAASVADAIISGELTASLRRTIPEWLGSSVLSPV